MFETINAYLLKLAIIAGLVSGSVDETYIVREFNFSDKQAVEELVYQNPDIEDQTGFWNCWNSALILEKYKVWVCEHKNEQFVVAFLIGYVYHQKIFYVRAIGVGNNYRRLGLASKLLNKAYEYAGQSGYIKLTIDASNDKARNCYKKFGFTFKSWSGELVV